MVKSRHGALLEDRGLMEIGTQPSRTLRQGLRHFLWASEPLRRSGGLHGAAKEITGADSASRPSVHVTKKQTEHARCI